MEIRWDEPDNVAKRRRFGQQVLIATEHITELHAISIRKPAGTNHMAFHIDDSLAVGKDWSDMHAISVLDGEGCNRLKRGLSCACRRKIEAQRLALFIRLNALDGDVVKSSGNGRSTSIVQHLRQGRTTLKFIDGRSLDHAIDRDLRPRWRYQQRVASLQTLIVHAFAVQQ